MVKENIYATQEKLNVLLNIEERDKVKFEGLYIWCARAMELTVSERLSKEIAPLRGEIWTCDLGVNVGSEMDKVRPCIIISPDDYNAKSNMTTVVPITHADKWFETQVEMNNESLSYKEGSLDGIGKVEQIRSISKSRLGKCIAMLSLDGMKAVEEACMYHLAIGSNYLPHDINYEKTEEPIEKNDK